MRAAAALLLLLAASAAQAVDWSKIVSPSQLAALSDADFEAATAADLQELHDDACPGFSAHSWPLLPSAAIVGLRGGCLVNVPSAALLKTLPAQASNFSDQACGSMLGQQLPFFSNLTLAAFTPSCVSNFGHGFAYACSAVDARVFASLSLDAVSAFAPACVGAFEESALALATPARITALPALACGSLTDVLVRGMRTAAYAGLTSACLQHMDGSALGSPCGGFDNSDGVALIPAAAFSGFNWNCIHVLPQEAFRNVTAAQLSAVNASNCVGFTGQQMLIIPPPAFAGWKPACVNNFYTETFTTPCSALNNPEQNAYFTPDAISGMRGACVAYLQQPAFSKASAAQVAALPASACASITGEFISGFSTASYAGFTPACVRQLQSTSFDPPCGKLANPAGFALMQAETVGNLSASCIADFPEETLAEAGAQQIAALTPHCSGLTGTSLRLVRPASFAGFTRACLQALDETRLDPPCNVLGSNGTRIAHLTPSAVSGLSAVCVSAMSAGAFSRATAAQVAALQPTACAGLTQYMMPHIPVDAYAGFTPACVAEFDTRTFQNPCAGLGVPQAVAKLSAGAFGALSPLCVHSIPVEGLTAVTAAQLATLDEQCVAMRSAFLQAIPLSAVPGITANCSGKWDRDTALFHACSGFTRPGMVPQLSMDAFRAITPQCIDGMPAVAFSQIPAAQVRALGEGQCGGLSAGLLAHMPAAVYPDFTRACVSGWDNLACVGLQPALSTVPPAAFGGMNGDCSLAITNDSAVHLSADQLAALQPATCASLSPALVDAVPRASLAGYTTSCAAAWTGTTCVSISADTVNSFNTSAGIGGTFR